MPAKRSNLHLVPQHSGSGRNIPPYLISFIGAAAAMIQGGTHEALIVFNAALIVAALIDIFRR
jgi:hypothetical protein